MLQLSQSESSIWYALSAISATYQDVESSLLHPAGYINANPEANKEWSTAVQRLSRRIETHPKSHLVPLVCCLIFTCVELAKGDFKTSMIHAQSGMNILMSLRIDNNQAPTRCDDLRVVEEQIIPMFSRLNILCGFSGKVTLEILSITAEPDSIPENLVEARNQFVEIANACLRFIDKVTSKATEFQVDMEDFIEHVKLETRLDLWRAQLEEILTRMHTLETPMQDAVNLLLLKFKVIYIWLRVCVTAGETETDKFLAGFEEVVQRAEQVFKCGATAKGPQPLSFDIYTLGPLYYTTLKCRHPEIRRRALELLLLAPRRDGVWNAHHAYCTAKRVIDGRALSR